MKIRELLSDESKWTQRSAARDANGVPVDIADADCWCLFGAVVKCYPDIPALRIEIEDKLDAAVRETHRNYINWNDAPSTTFADVKALVERLDV